MENRRFVLFVFGLFIFPGLLTAGDEEALESIRNIMVRFVELNESSSLQHKEAKGLLTGEASERWEANAIGRLAKEPDKIVLLDPDRAVARVQWFGATEQVTDYYFYLSRPDGWKIEAMRCLSLTGILERLGMEIKTKNSPSEKEKSALANIELTLAPDEKLIKWFPRHRGIMNQMVELGKIIKEKRPVHIGEDSRTYPNIAKLIRELNASSIVFKEDGTTEVIIGGILDNAVGFMHIPSGTPPRMSSGDYIWVEPIGDQWYLFRTT